MPDLSGSISSLRASGHQRRAYLTVFGNTTVMTATINATPTFPVTNISLGSVDSGASADVKAGMRVEVFTSAGLYKGRTRVRYSGTISNSNLPIRETSQGVIDIANTDTLKVYKIVDLSDKLVEATSTFDPEGISYVAQGSDPPPVVNSGGVFVGELSGGQVDFEFKGSTSFTVDPDSGGSITHLWGADGGSFVGPDTSTTADPTIRFTATGTRLIPHTVTDSSNSKTATQYTPGYVHDANDPPWECEVGPPAGNLDTAWSAGVTVFGTPTTTNIPDNSLVAIWVKEIIDGSEQSFGNTNSDRNTIKLVGYLRRDNTRLRGRDGDETVAFEIVSPLMRLSEILGLSKVMLREAAPDVWSEMKGLTVRRAITQLIQFYMVLSEAGFDFVIDAGVADPNYPRLFLRKRSPLEQIRELADAIGARFISDRVGRFELQQRPELVALADRNTITTTITLAKQDWEEISVARNHSEEFEYYRATGLTAATTVSGTSAIFFKWPGDAPGVGNKEDASERLVVANFNDGQDQCGMRAADRFRVFVNSSNERFVAPTLQIDLPGSYDVLDLYREWIAFSGYTSARGTNLAEFRWLVTDVSPSYNANGTGNVTVNMKAETFADGAVDDPPDEQDLTGVVNPPIPIIVIPPPVANPTIGIQKGTRTIFAPNDDGYLYYTGPTVNNSGFDIPSARNGPVWGRTDMAVAGMGGTLLDAVYDAHNSTAASLRLYCATTTVIGLLTITVATGAVTWSTQHTFATASSYRSMAAERAFADVLLCISYYSAAPGGTKSIATTDGATWGSEVTINTNRNTSGDPIRFPGAFVSGKVSGQMYARALDTTSSNPASSGHKSTDNGVSWIAMTNPILTGENWGGTIHVPWDRNPFDKRVIYGSIDQNNVSDAGHFIYSSNGTTRADITPSTGGNRYNVRFNRSIDTSPANRNVVIIAGYADIPLATDYGAVFLSRNGGSSWSVLTTTAQGASLYTWVAAVDDSNTFYMAGQGGLVAFVNDGVNVDNRNGNIATDFASAGRFVGLFGA